MKKNRLGTSDLMVSEMGLGCMSLRTEREKGVRIIQEAIFRGVNFFDTADLYDFGYNEEILGKAIQGRREEVIIATKVGNRWNQKKDGWTWDPSPAYIKKEVKESLRRLGTDYIDLYQLHGGTIEDPIDDIIQTFEELKEAGWIRYYGISSIRPNVIYEYVKKANIVSVMMQYNLLDRRPEELFPVLKGNKVSVIARGPVAKGLLTERGKEKIKETGYLDYSVKEISHIYYQLKEMATYPQTITGLALRYPLQNDVVSAIIPGASTVDQLTENLKAVQSTKLSEDQYKQIQQITKPIIYKEHRPH